MENKSLHISLTDISKKKKVLLGIIVVAGIAALLYFVLGGRQKSSGDYLTDTVKRGSITSSVSASGTVEPVDKVSLSFKDAEIVEKIYVKVGDIVNPDELLAELGTSNLQADLVQAQANLNSQNAKLESLKKGATKEDLEQSQANVSMTQASYDNAKAILSRSQTLFQSGAEAQSDLDQAKLDFATAEAKFKQAQASYDALEKGSPPEDIASAAAQVQGSQAQLQVAQNSLNDAKLYSPIEGIVSLINGAEGQRATANNNNTSGGGFMEVISKALQITAQINEGDIGKTKVGQKVEFIVNAYPNKIFYGYVSSISPTATTVSNVQIYNAVISLDQDYPDLKAGMPANVTIIIDRKSNVITIPKAATSYAISWMRQKMSTQGQAAKIADGDQTRNALVIVKNKTGALVPRRVELGISDLTNFEVLSGLNEGETIVAGSLSRTTPSSSGGQPPIIRIPGNGGGG